jgi:hypothetical protein
MTKLLYCVESEAFFMDPKPELPQYLLLDLNDDLILFRAKLNQLEYLDFDEKTVLSSILEDIMREGDAYHNVCVTNHAYLSDVADTAEANDVANYINARQEFANALIRAFQQLKFYHRGVLCYQIADIKPRMLILEKITVAVTDAGDFTEQDREYARQRDTSRRIDFSIRRPPRALAASLAEPPVVEDSNFEPLPFDAQRALRRRVLASRGGAGTFP